LIDDTTVTLPFNPTAENMANFLLNVVGPKQLEETGVTLVQVKIEETRKCSAAATKVPNRVATFVTADIPQKGPDKEIPESDWPHLEAEAR
jgi:hypothetical protein